ncbi:MAG: T9SS type A sorting domain-containing protein, partial [Ignavibacteriae bacterium]|nr:T9SS type A sorting domain-containing protein [Ignavibacteriota bacterium]
PFNQSTVIRFQLSVAGNASLKIFDMLGREVATLVNETLQPGVYLTTFDAKELASGVYIYTLQIKSLNGETQKVFSRRMLLLK